MDALTLKQEEAKRRRQFGRTILEIRRYMMLSQAELAQLLGIQRTTLAYWETAKSFPQPRHMRAIMEAKTLPDVLREELRFIYESVPEEDTMTEEGAVL